MTVKLKKDGSFSSGGSTYYEMNTFKNWIQNKRDLDQQLGNLEGWNVYYMTIQHPFKAPDDEHAKFISHYWWIGMARLYRDQFIPLITSIHPLGHSNPHSHTIFAKRKPYLRKKTEVVVKRGVRGALKEWWPINKAPEEEFHKFTKIESWTDLQVISQGFRGDKGLFFKGKRSIAPMKIETYDPTRNALYYIRDGHRRIIHEGRPFKY
jgi:hypothetical protein